MPNQARSPEVPRDSPRSPEIPRDPPRSPEIPRDGTELLVPRQEGAADWCTTTNEDEIWEYCDAHERMTLGWVHTHPTQV